MSESFTDKVVLVTGAARGLGACVLRTLTGAGAQVIGCDLRVDALARVVADVNATAGSTCWSTTPRSTTRCRWKTCRWRSSTP